MVRKYFLVLFLGGMCLGIFADEVGIIFNNLDRALRSYPSKIYFTEVANGKIRDVEFFSENDGSLKYMVGSSSDNNLNKNILDPRTFYKSGESVDLNIKEYLEFLNIPSRGSIVPDNILVKVNGDFCRQYSVQVTFMDPFDNKTYPLSGKLYCNRDTYKPYKLDLEYDKLPANTSVQSFTIDFNVKEDRSSKVKTVKVNRRGQIVFIKYSLNSTYNFEY